MTNQMPRSRILYIILAIQIAILGLVGLAALGFDIPVLRQIVGFIYLTFVPGFLLLKLLRLNRLSSIETLLYSVGLSIAFIMFTGFFLNMLYPLIGIAKPISILPLIATISVIVLILCTILYKREVHGKETLPQSSSIPRSELISPPTLFLLLLPVLAVLGTFLVYFHWGNTLSLIFLSLVALVVILVAFNKFIPTKLYPLAILAIGLGLVWQRTLISLGLTGTDTHIQYWIQTLVMSNSVWDYTIPSNVNAMLSVGMLTPIYSLILNIDSVWVFKIIYPLFFSLIPLALFQAYRKQIGDKIAFFGAFFFISMPYFSELPAQTITLPIAELFLTLSILLFLSKEMAATKRALLLIIFGLSIVVSHYGLSYIYMFYLLLALPLLLLQRLNVAPQSQEPTNRSPQRNTLTGTYVALFVVFCLAWYMYISSGSPLNSIIRIGDHLYSTLITEFLSPMAREESIMQAIGLGPGAVGLEQNISRAIYYITFLFIVVGVIQLITNLRKTRFHPEYVAFSLTSMALLAMCVILPYFASQLHMIRTYHIALLFLAPFCVLGGETFFRWLSRIFSLRRVRGLATSTYLRLVVMLVLVPYFLFQMGFIGTLTGSVQTMTLALYEGDHNFFTQPETRAREWLEDAGGNSAVYSDAYAEAQLHQELGSRSIRLPFDAEQIPQDSYIFLRRWNIVHDEILLTRMVGARVIPERINLESENAFSDALGSRNKIYDSGWAQILK